jgi:hypothetical protein
MRLCTGGAYFARPQTDPMGYYSRICTIDDYNTTDVKMGMPVAYIFGRKICAKREIPHQQEKSPSIPNSNGNKPLEAAMDKVYKHNLAVIFACAVLLLCASCAPADPYYGKTMQALQKTQRDFSFGYEYSFIQPEGRCTGFIDDGQKITAMISQGKPPADNETINGIDYAAEYNGKVYFTNNENVYCYDGKNTQLLFDKNAPYGPPLYLCFYKNTMIYLTEFHQDMLTLDADSLSSPVSPQPIGRVDLGVRVERIDSNNITHETIYNLYFDAAVAEGHVFYQSQDRTLHRVTIHGNEDTRLTKVEIWNIKYRNGYVYYTKDYCLWRMKTDGSEEKQITDHIIDGYWLMADGSIYCGLYDEETYKKSVECIHTDGSITKSMFADGIVGREDNLFAVDDGYLYYYVEAQNFKDTSIYRVQINNGEKTTLLAESGMDTWSYPPVYVNGTIYFYADKFYRLNQDGTGKTEIGPKNIYKSPTD